MLFELHKINLTEVRFTWNSNSDTGAEVQAIKNVEPASSAAQFPPDGTRASRKPGENLWEGSWLHKRTKGGTISSPALQIWEFCRAMA